MRKLAMIIGILGLGVLVALLLNQPRLVEDLDGLDVGEVVRIEGNVEVERKFGNGKILVINEVPVFCECSKSYVNKYVSVEGIVEKFPEDFRIKAFSIETID